jgi:hypothetical protein
MQKAGMQKTLETLIGWVDDTMKPWHLKKQTPPQHLVDLEENLSAVLNQYSMRHEEPSFGEDLMQ